MYFEGGFVTNIILNYVPIKITFLHYFLNTRLPNQSTFSIELILITIRIIRISQQSSDKDQQAKELRKSALSCIKNALSCNNRPI